MILRSRAAGLGSYTEGLAAALAERAEVTVARPEPSRLRGPLARTAWRARHIPRLVRDTGAQVVLEPSPELPLRRLPVPAIVVVHDVFPLAAPGLAGGGQRLRFRLLLPRVLARADAIVCVSETTRAALLDALRVPAAKVHVIGEGPTALPAVERPAAPVAPPYLLYVGELFERKNLATVLRALAGVADLELRIAGPPDAGRLAALRAGAARARVRHLGYVPRERLAELYAGATGFVLPSLVEGFGRTLLDAMALGTPAVVSDIPALRELAGDAALYVSEPSDPAAWRAAIERFRADPELRSDLTARGRARAKDFGWPAIAARFAALAAELADTGRRAPRT